MTFLGRLVNSLGLRSRRPRDSRVSDHGQVPLRPAPTRASEAGSGTRGASNGASAVERSAGSVERSLSGNGSEACADQRADDGLGAPPAAGVNGRPRMRTFEELNVRTRLLDERAAADETLKRIEERADAVLAGWTR